MEKGGQPVDTSQLEDHAREAANDEGVLVARVPLSLMKLATGKSLRVTAKNGACGPVASKVKL